MAGILTYVIISFLLPVASIYGCTYCRFRWNASRPGRPITPPYAVPRASHFVAVLLYTENFLRDLQTRFQGSVVSLSSFIPLYYVLPGNGVRSLFTNSRDIVPVPSLLDALNIFFGLPACDHHVFNHDNISSFESIENLHTSHLDPSRRIMEHQKRDFSTYLNGQSLKKMMLAFSTKFRNGLWPKNQDQASIYLADMYKFIRDLVFRAEVEALYGKRIFATCPSLCEDFWAFYDAFPVISRQVPRWLVPSHYEKRDKMQQNLHIWRNSYLSSSGPEDEHEIPYGTLYIRDMVTRYEKLGFSDTGIASVMLGYLFVTTANTAPAAAWMILHILLDESLLQRLREELSIQVGRDSDVDLTRLGQAPLFNSVYREVLRLHVAGTIGRKSLSKSFHLHDGTEILPGIPAMSASWLGGLDASFWNTGQSFDGASEYPVTSFWAERFLEYPDEPASGPLKSMSHGNLDMDIKQKTANDDSSAKLIVSGLKSHWFPFGGGAWKCPGEMLAKNTILVAVFLVLDHLDVDIVDPVAASALTPKSHRTLPFGSHAFGTAVPIRISRRTTP